MNFLDINTFYGPKAGGIRTYHQAKIDWFQKKPQHQYTLVYPGDKYEVESLAANVRLYRIRGPALTSDPQGYRLLWDLPGLKNCIRLESPQLIESGDPWVTGPLILALYRSGWYKGLTSSFYHSDPIPSYLSPWAKKGRLSSWKTPLVALAGALFYRVQGLYPVTVVSSKAMRDSLTGQGIAPLAYMPFGIHPAFFKPGKTFRGPAGQAPLRLLYAGRLDAEKGWDALMPLLDTLLAREEMTLTIAGRGKYQEVLAQRKHPRYHFAGFVPGADAMARLYADHDVLLAPGPFETFGLGVLEAMASGLVVVGPDAGGTAELLREAESPLIFSAGNSQSLLAKILQAQKSDLEGIAEKQMAVARQYGSWDDAIERLIRYYCSAIEMGGFSSALDFHR